MGSQQTSSTTATEIIGYARDLLNDDNSSGYFWDTDELLVLLNKGTMDIVTRTKCLEDTEDIDLVAGTIEYALTESYIFVETVLYTDANGKQTGLIKTAPHNLGHRIKATGTPRFWYSWNGKIGVYPTLSSRTSETVTAYLVSLPSTVVAGDNVLVPAYLDKALIYYIASEALIKPRQFGARDALRADYKAELDRYRADFITPRKETKESIG